MIDDEGFHEQNEPREDLPCCAPRGDFLIGLAQEALSFTRRRKLEKQIVAITGVLRAYDDKAETRRAKQLRNRLERLKAELNSNP